MSIPWSRIWQEPQERRKDGQELSAKTIPDQYAADDKAIREVMRDQMAMYDTAMTIAENPSDDAISEKIR